MNISRCGNIGTQHYALFPHYKLSFFFVLFRFLHTSTCTFHLQSRGNILPPFISHTHTKSYRLFNNTQILQHTKTTHPVFNHPAAYNSKRLNWGILNWQLNVPLQKIPQISKYYGRFFRFKCSDPTILKTCVRIVDYYFIFFNFPFLNG